ncbi:multicopper oxidase domain-containing protein [Mucilaginibacter segetis]|uniref:Multicopper oxidase domain-containing protein n=1 Tax=Mucilaginibacter segetis TaxID=2793071 RepID=A0A934UNY9_9SPHI|nr:multicopper oxidase domain-containing protein [Mucilaginibacter segetis]MBK0380590.1 multicopper oxidase domain-containing protein [Mucilaginibacter segetis]
MKKILSIVILTCAFAGLRAQNGVIKSSTSTLNDHEIKPGKRVVYDLYITDTTVNYAGKPAHAMAINGQIPGPVLRFTEGDTAYITVHNRMKVDASLHWHGIIIPNKYDGVPYLTTAPIKANTDHVFIFPLRQTGTYWYHSHSGLEEQSGLYGPIVIQPQTKATDYPEQVMLFSDWTNTKPHEVLRMLKRETDWFAIQKGSVQSYGEAASKGYFSDKLKQEWMRMPAMDISDVKYDRFLVNGTTGVDLSKFKPGQTVKLRLIDGSSSTYFWMQFAGGKMTVVAADGLAVKPVVVDKLLIGIAETYDVLITIPETGRYEFRATAQDVSGKVSAYVGSGQTFNASDIPKVPYFKMMHTMNKQMSMMSGMMMGAVSSDKVKNDGLQLGAPSKMEGMDMGGMNMGDMKMKADTSAMKHDMHKMDNMKMDIAKDDMDGMDMQDMKMPDDGKGVKIGHGGSMMLSMGGEGKILTYDMLKANKATVIDDTHPVRTYQLYLTGNMLRYVWSINNQVLSEADRLLVKKGDRVRFVIHNTTMMEHPMHLHGHFFRVLNAQGDYSPLKHTVSVEPMKTQVIEFEADAAHDWFFHCHVLYHMMGGMARVVRYADTPSNEEVAQYQPSNPLINDDRHWFLWGEAALQSQVITGDWFYSNTRYESNIDFRVSYDGRYEFEPRFQRYLDHRQYLAAYVGGDFSDDVKGNPTGKDGEQIGVVGLRYLLPLFLQTDLRISHKGRVRFMIGRQDIPVTSRVRLGLSYNTDNEYQFGTSYILAKNFALSASYDNQYGFGGGLSLIY